MSRPHIGNVRVFVGATAVALSLVLWQASLGLGAPASTVPTPNPLASNSNAALGPVAGVDITAPGPAATIHGDPVAGARKFALICASCHGERGLAGITNPGSNDGVVPTLFFIDPGFFADSNGDPAIFAGDIDLFVQHGSRPAGEGPSTSMTAFGDHKFLPQNDIADIEAYVMALNGIFWPDRCPGIQIELANPSPGARVEQGTQVVQGRAMDVRATKGSGVKQVVFFLDDRDKGGRFLGTASLDPAGTTSFQATLSVPRVVGGHNLFAYARSGVTDQEGVLSLSIAVGEDPSAASVTGSPSQSISCTP